MAIANRFAESIIDRAARLTFDYGARQWRIVYRIDDDAIVIAEVFAKTSQATPKPVIATSQRRLALRDENSEGES